MGTNRQRARIERRLAEVNGEIALLEKRIAVVHQLGDASSAQGISQTFNDTLNWQKRLDKLRRERDALEGMLDGGGARKINDGRVDVVYATN